ncbi:MAG: hypothetical protein GY747_05465 [Planctomycetes bacterium]|nr:hypothetical protein [Planctomycetota bacterium]MCP4770383.1 hypothetical protein [Planctomycetota bacterium]MCP4860525.1 hypothetical protein [Planctomycetota bacterium]
MVTFTRCESHPQIDWATPEYCAESYQESRESAVPLKEEVETRIWLGAAPDGSELFLKEYRLPPQRKTVAAAARSRALREWKALLAMDIAGLPVGRPMWFAESRRGPKLEFSVVATASLGEVVPLPQALKAYPDRIDTLCVEVGRIARQLHDAGFGHFRMQAKNFMVGAAPYYRVTLLDAPYSCLWVRGVPARIRRLDLEDLAGAHSVFSNDQIEQILAGYAGKAGPSAGLQNFRPGSRSRWGQKLRRIAYYLGAIWSGHRP